MTKLDLRDFNTEKNVPLDIKEKIFEAARSTGTALNTQHWRFIMIEKKENLYKLAKYSTSGKWISNSNFAIIVLTNPKYRFHLIDAGRALQNMQIAAWSFGVGSGIFTGFHENKLRNDFNIPNDLSITSILGFGYPINKTHHKKKNRLPLSELVYYEKYSETK
ncbi:MAG: nitroreductase family protein [Nitrososphaeraceae archaeon]